MRILITNDDGIASAGLKALADAAAQRGHEVFISAPSSQCSANSQHITLTTPLIVHKRPWPDAEAFAVDGTPSDCVRVAPCLTDRPFDFCLSGINHGENAGAAVYYSGTCAAAREAATLHIPAMAVSIVRDETDEMRAALAKMAVELMEKIRDVPLPPFGFFNLNAPALPPETWKPLQVCPLSQAYYLDTYERRVSPYGTTYFWLDSNDTSGLPMEPIEPGSDYAYLKAGHVTFTIVGAFQDHNDLLKEKMQES